MGKFSDQAIQCILTGSVGIHFRALLLKIVSYEVIFVKYECKMCDVEVSYRWFCIFQLIIMAIYQVGM